jgi:hypothetical protein
MSPLFRGMLGSTFFLVMTLPVRADDADSAKAIVEKAIKAAGPEEKLSKLKATTMKFKGTFHEMDANISVTGEYVTQGADQTRVIVNAEINGQAFTVSEVLNRDKGWKRDQDSTREMSADELKEAQQGAHETWLATLTPLKDKAYTLSTLGEIQVDDRPALGVRVASKGHRDVNLYFDKETHLLVKTQMRVKEEATGMEVNQESFYGDYKEVAGIKEAMKFVIKRDGKPYLNAEVEEIRREEKVDDSVFAKP